MKYLTLFLFLFFVPIKSHALGTTTATITGLSLIGGNAVRITVQITGGQTFTLPDLKFDLSLPLEEEQQIIRYVQHYLDVFNGKVLGDFANDLKGLTFSSSGLPPE